MLKDNLKNSKALISMEDDYKYLKSESHCSDFYDRFADYEKV